MATRLNFVEISNLNLQTPMNSKVCGRVITVSSLREWTTGGTKKASMNLELDDKSGSIEVTLRDNVAKKAVGLVQKNSFIAIENFLLKTIGPQQEKLLLTSLAPFGKFKTLVTTLVDPGMTQKLEWRRIPLIKDMAEFPLKSFTDVMGVIIEISEPKMIEPKDGGAEIPKQEIKLLDISNTKITVTFWRNDVERFSHSKHSIIVIRNAQVGFWRGPCLTFSYKSKLELNPQTRNAQALRKWFSRNAGQVAPESKIATGQIEYRSINDVVEEKNPEKFRFVNVNVHAVALIGSLENPVEKHFYPGCSQKRCHKKMKKLESGRFSCEKCRRTADTFINCMNVATQFVDENRTFLVATIFQNHLENLVPISANTLYIMAKADKLSYLSVLDQFLIGMDLAALFKVEHDQGALKWSLVSLRRRSNLQNVAKPDLDSGNVSVGQMDDSMSKYLGVIDECDLVPPSFREEQKSKLKK